MNTQINVKDFRINNRNYQPKKFKNISNIVSNDVYQLIPIYIYQYDIKIPDTFSLHPCGMYARKRLPHWDANGNGSMRLDATNLKEVIEEWINGPYMDKRYVTQHDLDAILMPNCFYDEGEAAKIAQELGISYNWDIKHNLTNYLKDTLPSTKVNFNGVKGITLYDSTNLEQIIYDFLKENYLVDKNENNLER